MEKVIQQEPMDATSEQVGLQQSNTKCAYVPPLIEDLGQLVPLVGGGSSMQTVCGEADPGASFFRP